jgi:transcriptional antiterminator RfaH
LAELSKLSWYLLRTHYGAEQEATDRLVRQGFQALYLKRQLRRKKGSKFRWVDRPFFPRYIFGQFIFEDHFDSIRRTIGLERIVRFGDEPAVIPADVIQMVSSRLDSSGYVMLDDGPVVISKSGFIEGDSVRIIDGAWEGFEAVFVAEMDDEVRVQIFIAALNKTMPFNLPALAIVPSAESAAYSLF